MKRYQETHAHIDFRVDMRSASPSTWSLLGEAKSKSQHVSRALLSPAAAEQPEVVELQELRERFPGGDRKLLSRAERLGIVVPLGESLIYLQPIYLQSTGSAFPEFRRIVVASPRQVVWGETLGDALRLLLAAEGSATPTPSPGTPTPGPSPTPGPGTSPTPTPGTDLPSDVAGLVEYANFHFETAQAALRAGDFATYGAEIALVETALRRLEILAPGLATPLPGATASPAP